MALMLGAVALFALTLRDEALQKIHYETGLLGRATCGRRWRRPALVAMALMLGGHCFSCIFLYYDVSNWDENINPGLDDVPLSWLDHPL
jgi:hypothetical protein